LMITLNETNQPFVAFSVDGGSNDGTYITRHHVQANAFENAPFQSYGSGGGAKVTVLAKLNPTDGRIERATFLIARLSNGNTNTFNPIGLYASESRVYLDVNSAAWPQAAEATQSQNQRFNTDLFNDQSRPPLRYELPSDLSEISGVAIAPE